MAAQPVSMVICTSFVLYGMHLQDVLLVFKLYCIDFDHSLSIEIKEYEDQNELVVYHRIEIIRM
jgi:hypothetical protein